MRYERLLLEDDTGSEPRVLTFHPALTVLTGQGAAGQEALVEQLVGSVAGGVKGAHAEIRTDRGTKLAIVRSSKVDDMVVEADRTTEVTADYTDDEGNIDVFAGLGIDTSMIRIEMEASPGGVMAHRGADDRDLDRLARLDQDELWQLVNDVALARAEAETAETEFLEMLEAQEAAADETDADTAEALDAFQEMVFETENTSRRTQWAVIVGSAVCFVAALGYMVASPTTLSQLLWVASVFGLAWGALTLFRMRGQQRAVKSAAGPTSLFTSQLREVDGILSSGARRRAVRESRATLETLETLWTEVTGAADLGWVIRNKATIREIGALHRTGGLDPMLASDGFGALVTRLVHDPRDTRVGEQIPLVFREPFSDMSEAEVQVSLQLLATSAERQQRIILTDNPVALTWARKGAEQQYLRLEPVSPTTV